MSPKRKINPLHKYMVANGLTAEQIADATGYVTVGAADKVMRFAIIPTPARAGRIAKLLGISMGAVLEIWAINFQRRASR